MALITAEYLRADGSPDEGKVTFELLPPALDDGNRQRTNTVVTAVLDNNGTIRVDLVPDASLLNVDGDAVYVVTEKVGGLNRSWHLLVADETEIDLNTRYPGTEQAWTGVVLPGAGGGVGIPAGGTQSQVLAKVDGTDYNVEWADPAAGGGGGTTDHSLLTNRSAANQHPTSAITGLDAALASKLEVTDLVAGTNVTLDKVGNQVTVNSSAAGGGGGHVVEDEGVALTSRSALNFIGAGVTATDNAGTDATDVTIPGGLDQTTADGLYATIAHTHPGELEGVWKYDDNTSMTSPASGRLRTNASGAASVTQVAVHNTTLDGLDMERFFTQLSVNDVIRFQQTDESNNYGSFRITAPVTVTGVYTIASVEFVDGGGVDILNNADLYVRIVYGTQGTTPLHPVATSGLYSDLSGTPTLGTASAEDTTFFATAAQGALADTSVQQDGSGSITTITAVTQATHDGLAPPDANTLYVIIPE